MTATRWGGLCLAAVVLAVPGWALAEDGEHTGSDVCKTCHYSQYKTWGDTGHAGCFEKLGEKHRTDRECLACHTTGLGKPGGFVDIETTPDLANVQCGGCHGPGSGHRERAKAAEASGKKIDGDPQYKMERDNVCIGCHNPHLDHKKMKRFLREIEKMPPPQPGIAENEGTLPYVGAEACAKCHAEHVLTWRNMGHSKAFDVLQKEGEEYVANEKCVACHTTGFKKKGGFADLATTPEMKHVQCEMCHGPASRHVAKAREAEGAGKKLEKAGADYNNAHNVCTACHNPHVSHSEYAK